MFVQGREYRRSDLHKQFGGQEQGGISTPSRYPLILLFTGEAGEQYGYADGWTNEGLFFYVGVNPNIKLVESVQLSWWISLSIFSTAKVFTKRIVGK